MVIGKLYRHFQGDFLDGRRDLEEGLCVGSLPLEVFAMGEEDFHEGGAAFSNII